MDWCPSHISTVYISVGAALAFALGRSEVIAVLQIGVPCLATCENPNLRYRTAAN
jgi:hypothetical protein